MSIPKILVLVGPTAVGKTALALELAKKHGGEVVSADSRQIFKEMSVGTGKPAGVWRAYGNGEAYFVDDIPHYGLDYVSPDMIYSVAEYKKYVYEKINEILSRGKLPIIVGGTGLYIWALVDNLDLSSAGPNTQLREELNNTNLPALLERLENLDPKGYQFIDRANKRRVVRAIEIALEGEESVANRKTLPPLYDVLQIGLTLDREELINKINTRIDAQIADGFEAEARELFKKYDPELPSMSSIGYSQWGAYFRGEFNATEVIQAIKVATHRYAKRQVTWFKRDKRILNFSPNQNTELISTIEQFIK